MLLGKRIKELRAEDKVVLAGSQKEVEPYYLKSKVFAFTSSSEGFPNVIGEKQLQQLDERIKPYLFCERWFPFAEYAGSLYLMLDYNPSEKGEIGQIICYVHDPDFIYYVAPNITEALKMTETVIENLI